MDLQHRVVWVVGASDGVGAAVAREMQARGARVAITARRPEALAEVSGGAMLTAPADVTDAAAMMRTAESIRAELGPVEVLVVAAGRADRMDVTDWDTTTFAETVQVNLIGASNAIGAVLPQMLGRGNGWVVGFAAPVAYRGFPTAEAYGAAKAGLLNLLEGLRADGAPHGLRVTTVVPSAVRTGRDRPAPWLPLEVDPDVAARAVCDGLERERIEIAFPSRVAEPLKLMRLAPARLWPALAQRWVRSPRGHRHRDD